MTSSHGHLLANGWRYMSSFHRKLDTYITCTQLLMNLFYCNTRTLNAHITILTKFQLFYNIIFKLLIKYFFHVNIQCNIRNFIFTPQYTWIISPFYCLQERIKCKQKGIYDPDRYMAEPVTGTVYSFYVIPFILFYIVSFMLFRSYIFL